MADSVSIRALRLAAQMAGGPAQLQDALGASSADVAAWLAGTKAIPPDLLLRVMELILDDLDAKDD